MSDDDALAPASHGEVTAPTAEDLLENEAGRLSARQDEAIRASIAGARVALRFHPDDEARDLEASEDVNSVALLFLLAVDLTIGAVGLLHGEPSIVILCALLGVPIVVAALTGAHRQWFRIVFLGTHAALAAAARADLEAGRVVAGLGRVTFEHGRYVVRCDGRLMRLPREARLRLPLLPGEHRVHYLPASRIVVALEPTAANARGSTYRAPSHDTRSPAVHRSALTKALYAAHRFDLRWLGQNRVGRLAPGQVRRALAGLWPSIAATLAMFTICALVAWLAPGIAAFAAWASAGVLGLVVGAGIARPLWRVFRDWLGGEVVEIDGPVRVEVVRVPQSAPVHFYVVGEEKLVVDPEAARALVPGVRYRVWLMPRSRKILGIEPSDGCVDEPATDAANLPAR